MRNICDKRWLGNNRVLPSLASVDKFGGGREQGPCQVHDISGRGHMSGCEEEYSDIEQHGGPVR